MSEAAAEVIVANTDRALWEGVQTQAEVVVSVVVPMYNEAARVADLCRAIRRWSPPFDGGEVVLVDDGSTDQTAEIVEEMLSGTEVEFRLVRLGRNRGKGAAVCSGVKNSIGSFVAYLDADLSVGFDQLERALGLLLHHRADVACGSRRHPDTVIPEPQPALRRLSGMSFNLMVRGLGLSGLRDTQCGFKLFTAAAAQRIFPAVECEGFAFDVEVLHLADQLGLNVVEVPVVWNHRDASKVQPLTHGTRMARALLGIRRRGGLVSPSTVPLPPPERDLTG